LFLIQPVAAPLRWQAISRVCQEQGRQRQHEGSRKERLWEAAPFPRKVSEHIRRYTSAVMITPRARYHE
jgi:hypothetical protein